MQQQRDIYIIGGGAIGKALAFFLIREGKKVKLIRVQATAPPGELESISLSLKESTPQSCPVQSGSLADLYDRNGLFIVTSKSHGNSLLAAQLRLQKLNGPIIIMQNGLGVERPFLQQDFRAVYRCVLFATSQLKNGVVHFKPVSSSPVGSVTGNPEHSLEIISLLENPYFRFHFDNEIETICWKKAISNIVFNSICPLLEVDNGVFARNPEVMELADRLIVQCLQVARQHGIGLTTEEIHDTVLMISRASDGQDISTLQDIRLGRQTEIDTLNMELCRQAEAAGLSNLVRETWLLGRMIQLKAALHAKQKIIS